MSQNHFQGKNQTVSLNFGQNRWLYFFEKWTFVDIFGQTKYFVVGNLFIKMKSYLFEVFIRFLSNSVYTFGWFWKIRLIKNMFKLSIWCVRVVFVIAYNKKQLIFFQFYKTDCSCWIFPCFDHSNFLFIMSSKKIVLLHLVEILLFLRRILKAPPANPRTYIYR